MATDLSELLDPAGIELNLTARRKPDIIRELTEILARICPVDDMDAIVTELMEREALSSTGIGSGIAIPHCLTPQVDETIIVFGRKLDGVKFDSVDNQPAVLFFLLAGPEGDHARGEEVQARLVRQELQLRKKLLELL